MKYIAAILVLLLLSCFGFANTAFEEGNLSYKDGNFEQAIQKYQEVLEQGEFGEVRYNLGNAFYKVGDIPNAILNYEKALKKQPNDPDIKHNLEIANLQVVDKIEPSATRNRIVLVLSSKYTFAGSNDCAYCFESNAIARSSSE